MMMNLKQLLVPLSNYEIRGNADISITGLTADSRRVGHGFLFIARRGAIHDGTAYISQAIAAGAAAVLSDLYDPTLQVTQVIHADPAAAERLLAAQFYRHPSRELFTVGITGTSGKTTTAYLVKHLLEPCGLIGTIEYLVGERRYQATHTTPDVVSNHRMLRNMIESGCTSAVMEVTSHALDQGRVAGIQFSAALFTNLSQDHLDYHPSMEVYCDAKAQLFRNLKGTAVVNGDSPWTSRVTQGCTTPIVYYGLQAENGLRAQNVQATSHGTQFTVSYKGQTAQVNWSLLGTFNVYNGLAAIGAALVKGLPLEQACAALATFRRVPGRLERVDNPRNLHIYVDYAHKPGALESVLNTLQPHTQGRLITVFGCGGDRDKTKRPIMGEIAGRLSEVVIITSDNPRSEDPLAICNQIASGISDTRSVTIEPDRRRAIEMAIALAKPEDLILIAGKGHETTQTQGHTTRPFDDREEALRACKCEQYSK